MIDTIGNRVLHVEIHTHRISNLFDLMLNEVTELMVANNIELMLLMHLHGNVCAECCKWKITP